MRFLILLAVLMLSAPAAALDRCMTGSWSNPDAAHEGVNVEVLAEDRALAYWYTYRFFDRMEQNWLLFVGAPADLVAYDVLPWAPGPIEYKVGTGTLTAVDQNTIQFSYDFTLELDQLDDPEWSPDSGSPWCLDERCAGVMVLKRLTQPIPCAGG